MSENKHTHTTEEEITFVDVKRMKNELSFEILEDKMISESKDAGNLKDVLEVEIDRYNGYKQKCIENNYPTNIKFYDYMIDTYLKIAKKYNINISMKKSNKAIDFTKIKWKLKTPTLAYLFYKLEEDGLIQIENIGATLSKIFVDNKQNDIDNITLNKYLNQLSLPKPPKTTNKDDIDDIVNIIKNIDREL